jgi:conjugative transposon TraN protein
MNNTILKYFTMIILLVSSKNASAQLLVDGSRTIALQVAYSKTSTILFPAPIKNANRGSSDILARKVSGAGNILQLKSAKKQLFPETNLTVLTGDGKLYHFIVNYAENPEQLNLQVIAHKADNNARAPVVFKSSMNESRMKQCAQAIMVEDSPWINMNRQRKYKIGLSLEGIYIEDNVMFYHLKVSNRSNIGYDIDMLRFYIDDKQNLKRAATQEIPVKPLYFYKEGLEAIDGNSTAHFVYALDKFTIPDAKHLVIEMFERNGGRNLQLRIRNGTIINARPVPE